MATLTTLTTPRALSPSPFDLHIQGVFGPTSVRRFRVVERISTPYLAEIDIDAALLGGEAIEIGARARLISSRTTGPGRTFHGVISSSERRGRDVVGAARYRLFVEPLFAGLRHTRHRRIFHDLTSVAVAQQILREHGVPHRLRILDEVPIHTHRIQYDESDLAFVERILFEEGIFYFFDHPAEEAAGDPDATNVGQTEVLVLCDTAQYYPRAEPVAHLVHRDFAPGEVVAGDETTAFDLARAERARPRAFLVRGRDPQRPIAELGDQEDRRLRTGEPPPESQDLGRRVFARRAHLVYESDGTLEDRPPTVPTARRLQDEARADAVETRGGSLNPYLMPGRVVRLEGHDTEPEDLVIVATEHFGEAPRDFASADSAGRESMTPYRNELTAAPATTTLRPSRRSKPRVDGFDAAIVVGPEGQEIHTDEHGRVKVHFLWDLESPYDDKASAWLRVMQPWGGAGFGAQFLPRVGMEVVVAFMAGDVDRPIVAGCVHNGASPPPFRYPEEKTKLGIRSRVSPGGIGFSEIVIDDARDNESLSIRSQRSMQVNVLGEHSILIGGLSTERMAQRTTEVRGDDATAITGASVQRIGAGRTAFIAGNDQVETGGDRRQAIAGEATETIGKSASVVIGKHLDVVVGAGDLGGGASVRATTNMQLGARWAFELTSGHSIRLNVGGSTVLVDRTGVHVEAPSFTVKADQIALVGGGASLSLAGNAGLAGGEVMAASKGAQLKLDADAHLDGAEVKLNCGPGAPPGARAGISEEKGTLTFHVVDATAMTEGRKYTMKIVGPDGEPFERDVDPEGKVTVEGRKGERFTLVELLCNGEPAAMTEV